MLFILLHFVVCVIVFLGVVTEIAGSPGSGYVDGTGTDVKFSSPTGIAVDALNNIYIADSINLRVRKLTTTGSYFDVFQAPLKIDHTNDVHYCTVLYSAVQYSISYHMTNNC